MKQLDVQIMGQSYLLGCPEGGEVQFRDAVARVDSAMCRIRDAGKVKARDRIAVLAALNLAFELSELASSHNRHRPDAPRHGHEAAPSTAGEAAASSGDLSSLLARLNDALGEDGRLI